MTGYIKKPHTSVSIGQTGCGKKHLVLELIEKLIQKRFQLHQHLLSNTPRK